MSKRKDSSDTIDPPTPSRYAIGMKARTPVISYILDVEQMLCLIEERLAEATTLAAKDGTPEIAYAITVLRDRIIDTNLSLFNVLIRIDDPNLKKHLNIRETPVGYPWRPEPSGGNEEDTVRITRPKNK